MTLSFNSLLSLLSAIASVGFVFFGITMTFGTDVPLSIRLFGVLAIVYGSASVVLLGLAWAKAVPAVERAARYLSIGFLGVVILGSLDAATISGLEWLGILLAAIMLAVNWLAVRRVTKLHFPRG